MILFWKFRYGLPLLVTSVWIVVPLYGIPGVLAGFSWACGTCVPMLALPISPPANKNEFCQPPGQWQAHSAAYVFHDKDTACVGLVSPSDHPAKESLHPPEVPTAETI